MSERRALAALYARMPTSGSGRLLDLGGGTGRKSASVQDRFAETVVVDPDGPSRARGRANFPKLTFVEGTAERIPFPDGQFDWVISVVSFHHFADARVALREIRRVLVAGGTFAVLDLRAMSLTARVFRFLHRIGGGEHLRFFAPGELEALLRAEGFAPDSPAEFGAAYLITARRT